MISNVCKNNFKYKLLLMLLVCMFSVNTSFAETNYTQSEVISRSHAQNFNDAALAFCVAQIYRDTEAYDDAMSTASAVDTWTYYDIEQATEPLNNLLKGYLQRNYLSKRGEDVQLNLLKCFDFYHSDELARLAREYVVDPDSSWERANASSLATDN